MSLGIDRLSHSFPPDYEENNKYIAKVHTLFPQLDSEFDASKVYYRGVGDELELDEVRALHKEWFPPQYPDDFYRGLLSGAYYRSLLCLYDGMIKGQKQTLVLGCATYEMRETSGELMRLNLKNLCKETRSLYILTIGVINEVRSKGIGTALLKNLMLEAETDEDVKYIYLDVVAYNDQGIRCYERNGFHRIGTKTDHYDLFGKWYDAYVYIYYVNGAERPRTWKEMCKLCTICIKIPGLLLSGCSSLIRKITNKNFKDFNYKELKV